MNTGLKWFVCLAVCVTIIGCEAENTPPEANPDPSTQKPLPKMPPVLSVGGKVSLPRVDGFCYETDLFDPTIEMRPLFDNEASVLIIRCRKTEGMGGIGAWETHALVWAERSLSAEVSYRTVNVQVHQFYPFDSGDRATQARYWPVDILSLIHI